ncbi:MAG: hypothetical protein M3305_08270 [Actinomycetota bacterium]|nr:hypothetical protein [Actinomycetota bacterium]
MFWRGDEAPEEEAGEGVREIQIERDAARPATILRVAGELEERGDKILELFKEVQSPLGQVVLPIHLLREGRDLFLEIETRPWDGKMVEETASKAAVLRNSEYAEAGLEILSAYPVPREAEFLCGRSPAALLQLDLLRVDLQEPQASAALFREVASRHWGVDLAYETEYLPLVEQLLLAALDGEDEEDGPPPILDALVGGLGCFVGETIRRNTNVPGYWRPADDWGEGLVLELDEFVLDPIGNARAFLREGPDDSVAFYADYVLEQLSGDPEEEHRRASRE